MADQRILWTEGLVGAGHPSKTDTLNRLALTALDSSGALKPSMFPAFTAYFQTTYVIGGNSSLTVVFDQAYYDDVGNYSTATGKFLLPSSGKWLIGANLFIYNYSNASISEYVGIDRNGATLLNKYIVHSSSQIPESVSFSLLTYNTAISTFSIHITNNGNASILLSTGSNWNTFWGIKIA